MQMQIEQMVYLVHDKCEVKGLLMGPMYDVRQTAGYLQRFATDVGDFPVRIDPKMKPDEWALVMGPPNWEKKKAEAVKELTKDLYSFLEVVKNPTIVYRNEDIHEQLTRAVLILLERTEKK